MITLSQAAQARGISAQRLARLCAAGRIRGAKLITARLWMVPDKFTVKPGKRGPKLSLT